MGADTEPDTSHYFLTSPLPSPPPAAAAAPSTLRIHSWGGVRAVVCLLSCRTRDVEQLDLSLPQHELSVMLEHEACPLTRLLLLTMGL